MYFILKGANFANSKLGKITVVEGQIGTGGTTIDPNAEYTLTVQPIPSDATVTLTATGYTQSGNTIKVKRGTQVSIKLEKTGYITQTYTKTVWGDETKSYEIYAEAVKTYTLTINPNPASATVTMNGSETKSITVPENSSVSWRVEKEGYTAQSGNWTATKNDALNITLVAEGNNGDDSTTTPDVPTGSTVFDFDFVNYTLADYVSQGIFTVPDTSTIDSITYDATKGANLNNNLPYGLTLTNPIDASRPWTLEFTATMVTPTALVGNRRAFLTGGSDLAPFVVINFSGSTVTTQGFQISNGAHKWVGSGKLICDQEVSYKFVHDGASNIVVYQNGVEFGTTACDFTGKTFGTILGVIKGKSSAYIWQDVESGKKSYLKKFKFSYN